MRRGPAAGQKAGLSQEEGARRIPLREIGKRTPLGERMLAGEGEHVLHAQDRGPLGIRIIHYNDRRLISARRACGCVPQGTSLPSAAL